ncbi:hypothetical protein PENTCL1PPCAC_13636, partial [Pristionchus entomophagus]
MPSGNSHRLRTRNAVAGSRLIASLHSLFGGHFPTTVIPQWEREICRQALAFDTRDPSSSMISLLHLLHLIWSAPYGWMPVAKRVAIGVLADMAHLNARSSLKQWVNESLLPLLVGSGCEREHLSPILNAFYKLMNSVPFMRKSALAAVEEGKG